MWANVVLAIAAISAFFFYWRQLGEMKRTNNLTQAALNSSDNSLSKTLEKMQAQVEATNNLYAAAVGQSAQTARSANYLKQSLEDGRKDVRFENAPWMGITKVTTYPNQLYGEVFTIALENFGRSPAFNVHALAIPQSVPPNTHPQIDIDEKQAKGRSTFFPTAPHFITAGIGDNTLVSVYKSGQVWLYLRIALWYEDSWHINHFDTFCQFYDPRYQSWVARKPERCED